MPTSIREQLIDAITTAVSGEYRESIPENVQDLPVCGVLDGDETSDPAEYGCDSITLPVGIAKAAVASDTDKAAMRAQANELLASIRADMFADETFGGLAVGVEYAGGGISTERAKICFAEAQFIVRYQTVRGDPYTID